MKVLFLQSSQQGTRFSIWQDHPCGRKRYRPLDNYKDAPVQIRCCENIITKDIGQKRCLMKVKAMVLLGSYIPMMVGR